MSEQNKDEAFYDEQRQIEEYERAMSKENILKYLVIKHVLEFSKGYVLTRPWEGGTEGFLEGLYSYIPHNGCVITVPIDEASLTEYGITEEEAWRLAEQHMQTNTIE